MTIGGCASGGGGGEGVAPILLASILPSDASQVPTKRVPSAKASTGASVSSPLNSNSSVSIRARASPGKSTYTYSSADAVGAAAAAPSAAAVSASKASHCGVATGGATQTGACSQRSGSRRGMSKLPRRCVPACVPAAVDGPATSADGRSTPSAWPRAAAAMCCACVSVDKLGAVSARLLKTRGGKGKLLRGVHCRRDVSAIPGHSCHRMRIASLSCLIHKVSGAKRRAA